MDSFQLQEDLDGNLSVRSRLRQYRTRSRHSLLANVLISIVLIPHTPCLHWLASLVTHHSRDSLGVVLPWRYAQWLAMCMSATSGYCAGAIAYLILEPHYSHVLSLQHMPPDYWGWTLVQTVSYAFSTGLALCLLWFHVS